jgi:hypothetical protein
VLHGYREFDDVEVNDEEDQDESRDDGIARRKAKKNKPTDKPVADESTDEPTDEETREEASMRPAETSSSTGGPVWVKPAARGISAGPAAGAAQAERRVTTVMDASGLLKTSVVIEDSIRDRTPVTILVDGLHAARVEYERGRDAPIKASRVSEAGGFLSLRSRQDLSSFIATAILPKTNRVYEKEWGQFQSFVKEETGSDDPFLTKYTDDEKASLVALMMMRRHQEGKRGKAATAFTAAVRQMYAREMNTKKPSGFNHFNDFSMNLVHIVSFFSLSCFPV